MPTPVSLPVPMLDDELSARFAAVQNLGPPGDGAPDKPRTRSVSGEIRVPVRRAPSIKPPLPGAEGDEEEDEPLIMIEMREEEDELTGPRPLPVRRRPIVKSDPPELYARAGEVDLKSGPDRAVDDEPRIVIDEDALAPETGKIEWRAERATRSAATADAAKAVTAKLDAPGPAPALDALDDADTAAVIHDRVIDHASSPTVRDGFREEDDADTGEIDIVVLDAPKKPRPERHTQVGVPPAVNARTTRDTETNAPADPGDPGDPHDPSLGDATSVDLHPAPPGDDTTSDQLAAPPAPVSDADTNPHIVAAPPAPAAARPGTVRPAVIVEDDDEDDEDEDAGSRAPRGPHTSEMTAAELDDAVPERTSEVTSDQLLRRRIEHDSVDDGWGPPGTTIPPPLLGAIPGGDDEDENAGAGSGAIPMPNVDSSPLLVGTTLSSAGDPSGRALARALEDATARAIDVIRQLEHTQTRDDIIGVMIAYLAETHHRAGFFVTKHAVSKDAGDLALFAMTPRPAAMPSATLRLDRPSTLQDVVGTHLPYRGPMHDDASRAFLVSVLGACPAEILLVPVTVRERVVGVLFGEHRLRHTFDDQLALAARAAGMALERILRSRRS
jgi:hypothetical protein